MRLVLIDGHAILHRAYHALPPLTTSKGNLVNAVFGFVSMLLRVVSDLQPTHLVVVFDRPKPTFRKKIFKDYQAKRPKMAEELASQIDLVHKVVATMGIPIYEMDGYEADDIIASLAAQASDKQRTKEEIIIVTGDRDLLQLISDRIKVYMPVKGLSESKLYGEKEVEEKFGIKPEQIVDYKALVGDQSDNYPGVAGIGPKTAITLLSSFKTLEQIYQHLSEIENGKIREKLEESKEEAETAKKLATVVTDAPVKLDLEKCKIPNFDRPDVHLLFEKLEFRSLIPRLSFGIRNSVCAKTMANKQEIGIKNQGKKDKKEKTQQIKLF